MISAPPTLVESTYIINLLQTHFLKLGLEKS